MSKHTRRSNTERRSVVLRYCCLLHVPFRHMASKAILHALRTWTLSRAAIDCANSLRLVPGTMHPQSKRNHVCRKKTSWQCCYATRAPPNCVWDKTRGIKILASNISEFRASGKNKQHISDMYLVERITQANRPNEVYQLLWRQHIKFGGVPTRTNQN